MPTVPYSRSGMDPFQQARRKRTKARAEAQRRYRWKHRKEIREQNRERYACKKAERERLAAIESSEAKKRAEELREKEEELRRANQPPTLGLREAISDWLPVAQQRRSSRTTVLSLNRHL